jgi:hypothetical protein
MWDPAENLAITAAIAASSETVRLDGVTFPWLYTKDTPISNSHVPMCLKGDTSRWGSYSILAGTLAKSMKQGKPEGYEALMKLAGFTLPSSLAESDHSILQLLPI